MESKLLVLTMSCNNLDIEVRPEFPEQKFPITLEADQNNNGYRWMLAGVGKDQEVTVMQLSEYLLRPILCSATID